MLLRYLLRALKSMFLFFLLGTLVYVLTYLLGRGNNPDLSFMDLIRQSDINNMVIFFVAFGFIYPLIGFVKQKVYLNRPFEGDKQEIIRMFADVNFLLEKDENNQLYFRHKNPVARIMRLGEDKITVDYSDNPLVISGLRKDAYRLARMIQYYARKAE